MICGKILLRLEVCLMYEYNFSDFKKADDTKVDSSRLASTPAKIDIFSQFEELDDINNSYEDVSVLEQTFEEPIEAYNESLDFINELDTSVEEDLDKTMEIDTITDEVIENYDRIINSNDEVLKNSDTINIENDEGLNINEPATIQNEDVREKKEPMSIATAFINCSVLGFITMFFAYGMFFYIMSQI